MRIDLKEWVTIETTVAGFSERGTPLDDAERADLEVAYTAWDGEKPFTWTRPGEGKPATFSCA